jgi:two-component system, NtrC family, C4-dicarboxylate transport sensor histidine kinase DctB
MTARFDDLFTHNRQATVARLVSGAAHEVNNALQVISGSAELLMTSKELPDRVRDGLERIAAHSARAAAAMTGVTVLSRPVPEAHTPVDLRDVATRAASLTRYSVARAGLSLSVEPGDEPLQVEANAPRLLLAVVNLIANAEQALDGRRSGRITIAVSRDGSFARLAVSDDGPGLSAQMATQAFDAFVTTKPRPDSVGLGLPVARAIAETHAGSLSVEPSASGATFVLRVPLA